MAKNLLSTTYYANGAFRLLKYTIDFGDTHDDYVIEIKNDGDWVHKHSFNSISNDHAAYSCHKYINELKEIME